jgi:hypothetical protein
MGVRRRYVGRGVEFMKIALLIVISGLAFCGCSQKTDPAKGPALAAVVAGQDSIWADGLVLHVAKRDGNALEGILVVRTAPTGQKTTIIAEKGTLSEGPDRNSVKLTLQEAQSQSGNTQTSAHLMNMVLRR